MPNLTVDTGMNGAQELQQLLAQQAEINARIASLLPSSAPAVSSFPHQRSPIHKHHQQQHHRRSNVPRSMSSTGTTMASHLSSDRIEAPSRTRTLSQHSSHSMARTNSRGSTSARGSGNVPFTQTSTMPPPLLTDSRRESPVEAWASQDQPFNSYTISHQPQVQRMMSPRKPELQQVPEFDSLPGDDPADFMLRTGISSAPILQLPPASVTVQETQLRHRLSTSSRHSYSYQTPTTPMSDSLTNATTLMSRQNSLCTEPLLESIQMMNVHSNTSFSDVNPVDHTLNDHSSPYSSRHNRRSSQEEQYQLLVGAGGASHDSQFSQSPCSAVEVAAQFHSSVGSYGEQMEKTQSNESSSSSSSRSKQRLQAQNALAAARPLMPKGGNHDTTMSRENSSQSMSRHSSKDGLQDKIAISKPNYVRPKHDRVQCTQCDEHPDGFRGEHELRRHQDRQHKPMVKKWICVQPQHYDLSAPKPVVPLHKCKACTSLKKKYGAYYNAAAHLRRAHFRPKASKGRAKAANMEDTQKRGGKAGGDWPLMADLKHWMKEVEEPATDYNLSAAQQQEADEDDDDLFNFDEQVFSNDSMTGISNGSFDTPYSDASFNIYPSPTNTDLFGLQNMQLDLSSQQQAIDSSIHYTSSRSNFDSFAVTSFPNDAMSFMEQPSSLPSHLPLQNIYDDQSLGLVDPVHFSYL